MEKLNIRYNLYRIQLTLEQLHRSTYLCIFFNKHVLYDLWLVESSDVEPGMQREGQL